MHGRTDGMIGYEGSTSTSSRSKMTFRVRRKSVVRVRGRWGVVEGKNPAVAMGAVTKVEFQLCRVTKGSLAAQRSLLRCPPPQGHLHTGQTNRWKKEAGSLVVPKLW